MDDFNATLAEFSNESMACDANVFGGPACVGAVIDPSQLQTMISKVVANGKRLPPLPGIKLAL